MGIMETFDFQPSIRLVFGPNQIDQLGQLTKELAHPSKVLLITDQGVAKAGILDRAIDALKSMDIDTHILVPVPLLRAWVLLMVQVIKVFRLIL